MATHDPTLEYLTTTKIGEKGQLTVPKPFREDLRLENGAPFAVLRLGDSLIILLPEQQRLRTTVPPRVNSSHQPAAGLTSGDLLATLPEARNRVYARRYEKKGTSHRPPAPFSKLSRKATGQRRIRLFLDSNVLTGGILSPGDSTRPRCQHVPALQRCVGWFWPKLSAMKSERTSSRSFM